MGGDPGLDLLDGGVRGIVSRARGLGADREEGLVVHQAIPGTGHDVVVGARGLELRPALLVELLPVGQVPPPDLEPEDLVQDVGSLDQLSDDDPLVGVEERGVEGQIHRSELLHPRGQAGRREPGRQLRWREVLRRDLAARGSDPSQERDHAERDIPSDHSFPLPLSAVTGQYSRPCRPGRPSTRLSFSAS